MRVAVYNQMFALNGESILSHLRGHIAIHYQKNPERAYEKANLDQTIDLVRASQPDIIGICEILEGQEKELQSKFKKVGYNYVYFGTGRETKTSKMKMKVALASKINCEKRRVEGFPIEDKTGGGGGIIHCRFPNLKLDVMNVHFGFKRTRAYYEQLRFLQDYLHGLKNKVILMGDFNRSHKKLQYFFDDLELSSSGVRSCSTTPVLRHFIKKDFDHIFSKGFEKSQSGEIKGYSDHKLVYVDFLNPMLAPQILSK
jgi:endonuclease/exonuclease/phosphatase (EEP) superfamily protein YafD